MRTALIEIGTRAIRLLVAEIDGVGGLRIVHSGVTDNPLGSRPTAQGGSVDNEFIDALTTAVEKLVRTADRYSPSLCTVFGTEGVRQLNPETMNYLRSQIPALQVLAPEEEAAACHASACLVARDVGISIREIISGDIGSGSFELCAGLMEAPGQCAWSIGTLLGSNHLRELYIKGGLAATEKFVSEALESSGAGKGMGGDSLLCFSGSAATKYAWVRYKAEAAASNDLRYDMKRVQGTVISGDQLRVDLAQLDALRSRDRSRLATLVSPEKPNGPEIEILVSGMQTIATTLLYTGCPRFMVNAFGARHGLAWMKLTARS